MEALLLVAAHDVPSMMARIGVMRALHRHKPKPAPAPRRKRAGLPGHSVDLATASYPTEGAKKRREDESRE
jgi:hypothetical protein